MKTNSISTGLAVHARTIATPRHLIFRRAWLWTGFLAFTTIAFWPRPAQAAVTEAWVHRFSNVVSNVTDEAVKVVRDAAGDIIVTGTTAGGLPGAAAMLTIKYSGADGSALWQQRYNGPENGLAFAKAVAVDGNGNVVVTGVSHDEWGGTESYTAKYAATDGALLWERRGPANLDNFASALALDGSVNVVVTGSSYGDYYTAKYAAADGALLWEKRYNSTANSGDFAEAVAVDGGGNVVVTGTSYYLSGYSDFYTAKYAAADGALLWEKRYGAANSISRAPAVAVDGSGNVVVTGSSESQSGSFSPEIYTAKYAAADGALLWEKRYGAANSISQAPAVAVDGSGNVVVTGGAQADSYTVKYAAADGTLLWEKRYNGAAYAVAVAVDGSGNVVVTGNSYGTNSRDFYTAKYAAADGALLWEKGYNGPANVLDSANAVTVDGSGNVVVTGRTDAVAGLGTTGGDYYTAKYAAADGALLWEKRYNGSKPNDASAQAVAVDGSGNVVVTGVAYNWGGYQISDGDYYTAKYAAANGALLWEKRYNGPANGDDRPSALAVDGSGNVVVTGYSVGESGDYDYYTARYAAANGALLWEKRYGPAANSWDNPYAVAVDGSGNVVVTGQSINTNSNDAYYTAKYAAADGALLWERRANGGGTAVTVDGSGNVVVTGSSFSSITNYGYYTAKYAAANGALLWEKRYNGPANSGDSTSAVAVDGNGNVVVTGSSGGDYCTAKYAAADGALLWEKGYNGPANSSDYARAVAVDGSGNVVVTGNSWGGNTSVDYYTAKYASADGGLLWEKRFTGPASVGDSSHCLALGPDGMVAVTGTPMVAVTDTFNGGYATVVYRVVPAASIDLISSGVRLRVTGLPGRSYNIERAPAVTGPWSTINTQTAPESGPFEYLDTNPPSAAAFYRTSEP